MRERDMRAEPQMMEVVNLLKRDEREACHTINPKRYPSVRIQDPKKERDLPYKETP
jgi:hypothetical protein